LKTFFAPLSLTASLLLSLPGCSGDASSGAVGCGPGTRLDGDLCVVDVLPPGGGGGSAAGTAGGSGAAPGGSSGAAGKGGKGGGTSGGGQGPGGASGGAGQAQGGAGNGQGGAGNGQGGAGNGQGGAGNGQGGAGNGQGGAGNGQGGAGQAQGGAGQEQGGAGAGGAGPQGGAGQEQGGAGQSQGGAGDGGMGGGGEGGMVSSDSYVHPMMCGPGGEPPVMLLTPPLPPLTLAVNGVLSCSNQPPPRQNTYTDGELLFYWCSGDAKANNESFVARLFDAGGGLVIPWLEEHRKDGSTGFFPSSNFVGLVLGQVSPIWDLLSFADGDPRDPIGWRPPAPETHEFKEGDLIIDWADKGRQFLAHVTEHNTVEAIDNDGKFTVSEALHNLEQMGLKPNQWLCFAECRTNDDCVGLMYPASYSCVPEKGRCLP
jgi:hypothetical protein